MIVRSVVKPELLRRTLWRGSFLAALGLLFLLFGALFLPEEALSRYGPWLFALGGGLLTAGLLPYRRLSRLEIQPDELHLTKDQLFWKSQKVLIPLHKIQSIQPIVGDHYGIQFQFKDGHTLFLPYFSERGAAEIQQLLTQD